MQANMPIKTHRVVNDIHFGVVQQLLIAPVRLFDTVLF